MLLQVHRLYIRNNNSEENKKIIKFLPSIKQLRKVLIFEYRKEGMEMRRIFLIGFVIGILNSSREYTVLSHDALWYNMI